jgi:hypothetical protein
MNNVLEIMNERWPIYLDKLRAKELRMNNLGFETRKWDFSNADH